jgi:glycosyltransferase involved in cell wall biosynthesis
MKISIVSDVPWGYGSPQIGYLRESLFAGDSEIQYLVPIYPDRPLLSSKGVTQVFSEGNPFTWEGMIAFGKRAAAQIEEFAPDKLIVVNPRSLAVLPYLKIPKSGLIYYGLEPILDHGLNFYKSISLQKFSFNMGIFPNTERAQADARLLSLPATNVRVIRNVPKLTPATKSNGERNVVTYAGGLDPKWVNLQVLEEVGNIAPLEIWGHVSEKFNTRISNFYRGDLPHSKIATAYESSALSLIIWNPINFGTRNAAPNKFFEAMSYGVPSVSFPYPQVVEFVTKYGIGFVSPDFTKESFLRTLSHAYETVPSHQYQEMRELCLDLHRSQLNWERESNAIVKEILSDQ